MPTVGVTNFTFPTPDGAPVPRRPAQPAHLAGPGLVAAAGRRHHRSRMPDRRTDPPRATQPTDATLSVTRAARVLGVHPNTIRAWSDRGLLRHYRINVRGDRRFRLTDLERFLAEIGRSQHGTGTESGDGSANLARPPKRDSRRPGAGLRPGSGPTTETADALVAERRQRALDLAARVAALVAEPSRPNPLAAAVRTIRDGLGLGAAGIWALEGGRFTLRAGAGIGRVGPLDAGQRLLTAALRAGLATAPGTAVDPILGLGPELAAALPVRSQPAPLLWLAADDPLAVPPPADLAQTLAGIVAAALRAESAAAEASQALQRTEALRRIALDLGGRLDLDQVLEALVDHALVFFGADRAAIALAGSAPGRFEARIARGLSPAYLAAATDLARSSLAAEALAAGSPRMSPDVRTDPREAGLRAAAIQEGVATRCVVPLVDGGVTLGLLDLYRTSVRPCSAADLATFGDFAAHAGVAIRTARDYGQMARWTAQLASIQQLGARLSRLSSVREIGEAIVSGLSELIDHHNVRVYRRYGEDLVPVAMRGRVGEYVDETPDQLRTKVGLGLTGWVAEHRVAQIVGDAAHDPRALTIPGTDADLDESMLLAPMLYEDDVLGVLVLSKLGLHQFTDDDLRLLVIYASFAAQAMANADATERLRAQSAALERQLLGQRELLRITESILATLDPRAVLDQVADGLAAIIGYDRITIAVLEPATGTLRPLAAKGLAMSTPETWDAETRRLAMRVVRENTARVVDRTGASGNGAVARSVIAAPLRGRTGATGILMLERFGARGYTPDEFELVKVFAAQVAIALQNAEAHRAVALRAQTDALTGLLNHGTFQEWLVRLVETGEAFGLLMLDLDDFKSVNDALGHQAGDRYLREIATAIQRTRRETDWVFRYGGDEFAVILRGTDMAGTLATAGRIRDAVLAVGGPGSAWARAGLSVSCSIGAATYPTDGRTADEVLLAADRACFVAKRAGPGRIATAAEGEALAGEIALQVPTPVDPPSLPVG